MSLARAITRRPDSADGLPIRYAGAESAVLWAFLAVSAIEIPAVHFLIPWAPVRIVALILGVWGALLILGMIAAHHVYPHLLTTTRLRVRYLRRTRLDIVLGDIRSVHRDLRGYDGAKSTQLDGKTLAIVAGSATNVRVNLAGPQTFVTPQGEFTASAIAFWADDPGAAVSAIRAGIAVDRTDASSRSSLSGPRKP
ncbi:hypothetical protein [Nocardia sp. AG03]|uniref:hypothetical protein n=1 Tax=Nocardia sp. AG03 TaxID=3025312 RepID=UPI0024189ABE|nr:hypothetical protein [Nocardia sp. AG03]